MMETINIDGPDQSVAVGYIFQAKTLVEVCEVNAAFAKERGRFDHERVFSTLKSLFKVQSNEEGAAADNSFSCDPLAARIVMQLYVYPSSFLF